MESTLKGIQILSKIGKVISEVLFVVSLVGAVCCLVGILALAAGVHGAFKIGGVQIYALLEDALGEGTAGVYMTTVSACIFCTAHAVVCKFSQRYFSNELCAGTPFTMDGSREMLRLGILTVSLSVGSNIISKIVCAVIEHFLGSANVLRNTDADGSAAIGIMFIILSFILKYGAEREKEYAQNRTSDETIRR